MTTNLNVVESLLMQAEQAHGQYEQTVLDGVYDQDWAIWYANFVIDQGIEKVLGRSFSGERLSQFSARVMSSIKQSNLRKLGLPILLKSWWRNG